MADLDNQTEEAMGWAAEGKKLAVDIPEVSLKDAATFVASATPIIGDAMAAKDVYDELQKDEPNYYLAGALGGAALVGLVPGLGDAAAKAIKKGAKEVFDVAKRVEVDPNAMGSGLGNVKLKPKEPFKKTRSAYRIATQSEDGKLYPLFVNASDEIPVGEWISASVPPVTFKGANGNMYVPSKGAARSKGEKSKATGDMQTIPDADTADKLRDAGFSVEKPSKSAPYGKVRAVASRPGFHATTKPVAHHLGPEDLIITSSERDQLLKAGVTPKAFKAKTFNYLDGKLISKKKVAELSPEDKKKVKSQKKYYVKRRAEDQVFVEVDMADDTSQDLLKYMQERGRTDINDKLPSGGSYTYQDGQADAETWVVGGDMKVNRVLSREEAKAAQEAAGVKDLPYRSEIEEILGRKFAKGGLVGEENMYTGQQDSLIATGMADDPMQSEEDQTVKAFALGGLAEDVDPVSGNEVPIGSMPEEVRDDIPAQLSEGEYVVPADVVRFFGVKFFEDIRAEAKQGFAAMEANGRIGGEPVEDTGMEMGGDDLPFDVSELQMVDDSSEEQPMMNKGGYMSGYAEGGAAVLPTAPDLSGIYGTGVGSVSNTGFQIRTYIGPDGQKVYIQFMNGVALTPIPEGYTLEGGASEQVATDVATAASTGTTFTGSDSAVINPPGGDREQNETLNNMPKPEAIDWTQASPDEFYKVYNQMYGTGGNIVTGVATALGGSLFGFGVKGMMRLQENAMKKGIDDQIAAAEEAGTDTSSLIEIKNVLQGKNKDGSERDEGFFDTITSKDTYKGNSFTEALANMFTPDDGASYVDGQLVDDATGARIEPGGQSSTGNTIRGSANSTTNDTTNNTRNNNDDNSVNAAQRLQEQVTKAKKDAVSSALKSGSTREEAEQAGSVAGGQMAGKGYVGGFGFKEGGLIKKKKK